MTDKEFEEYLASLERSMAISAKQRGAIADELRDHFDERLGELLSQGHSPAEAVRLAMEEFGTANQLAENFVSINQQQRRRWVMRFATFSIAGSFVAALLIFSLWPDQERFPIVARSAGQESTISKGGADRNSVQARNEKTRNVLNQTIRDFTYEEANWADILQNLREQTELEFYLDDSSDLKMGTPISFKLRNVRLSMALELLLREHNSEYIVRDGIILIASTDAMSELGAEIRQYDCRDLTLSDSFGDDPQAGADEGGIGGAAGRSDRSDRYDVHKSAKLMELIRSTIAIGNWEEGGRSIQIFDGVMIVNNSAKAHEQIEELLSQLRQVRDQDKTASSENPLPFSPK